VLALDALAPREYFALDRSSAEGSRRQNTDRQPWHP
jgi:hypothetical protein